MKNKINRNFIITAILIISGCGAIFYFAAESYFFREKTMILEEEISQNASSTSQIINSLSLTVKKLEGKIDEKNDKIALLGKTIDQIGDDLEMTQEERNKFEKKYKREKDRMDEFNSQIDEISGNVDTLQQLEATDDELLMKYSKVYFLNENYGPESLAAINPEYTINPDKEYLFYSKVLPFLNKMVKAAATDEINLRVVSAFRSFNEQSNLKSAYTMTYGSGANRFSADQGYSEHQLGTTVDLSTKELGANFSNLESTEAYKWLTDNAYKYGFVLSYPKNNSYYQYEPWHWRFVGRTLADMLHEQGKNFYDLEQREIDKYQISFFD